MTRASRSRSRSFNSQEKVVRLPHLFEPRTYQLAVLQALDSGIKRAIIVWHRRSGKDKTLLNYAIKTAWQRKGTYFHLFPTYNQGRRIIWEGKDYGGMRFLDHIPDEIIARKNESTMRIEFKNGSAYQVVGTDQLENLKGTNPIGAIFSEYSYQNERAWKEIISPILVENNGWAAFCYTPNGQNHGYDLYEMAKKDSKWFTQLLTVRDTNTVTEEEIEQERRQGVDEDIIRQEYYCSFQAGAAGAYYGQLIERAETEGRICDVPYDPALQVETWWDIGIDDSTAIWFTQQLRTEVHVIDYYETQGKGVEAFGPILQTKPYTYESHNFPHDADARQFSSGKATIEIARSLFRPVFCRVLAKHSVLDRIAATRRVMPRCYFDRTRCERGIKCLRNYHKEYNEKLKAYDAHPCHDWASHAADAFGYFSLGFIELGGTDRGGEVESITECDLFGEDYGRRN